MSKSSVLFLLALLSAFYLQAQTPDSLSDLQFLTDTTTTLANEFSDPSELQPQKKKRLRNFLTKNYPDPKKAALLSFVLPGMGQAYNGKLWKMPIVYTAVGTTVYLIGKNAREYRRHRTAYKQRVNGEADEFVGIYTQADRIKTIRDGYRKNREQSYIGLVVALTLSAADAFVDAHLLKFNVNDDLSMRVKPSLDLVSGNSVAFGLGLGFSLGQ